MEWIDVDILLYCHNDAKYVAHALDSILRQNYPRGLVKIRAIDDGSNDGLIAVLQAYQRKFPRRIFITSTPFQGKNSAYNQLIKQATGHYIFFMTAHSILAEDALFNLVNTSNNGEIDVILGRIYHATKRNKTHQLSNRSWIINPFWYLIHSKHRLYGNLYKRSFVVNGRYEFQGTFTRFESVVFNFYHLGLANKVSYFNGYTYIYPYHPSTTLDIPNPRNYKINADQVEQVLYKLNYACSLLTKGNYRNLIPDVLWKAVINKIVYIFCIYFVNEFYNDNHSLWLPFRKKISDRNFHFWHQIRDGITYILKTHGLTLAAPITLSEKTNYYLEIKWRFKLAQPIRYQSDLTDTRYNVLYHFDNNTVYHQEDRPNYQSTFKHRLAYFVYIHQFKLFLVCIFLFFIGAIAIPVALGYSVFTPVVNPTDYAGSWDGSDWRGRTAGNVTCAIIDDQEEPYASLISNNNYAAINLAIPDFVKFPDGTILPLAKIGDSVFADSQLLTGSLAIGNNIEIIEPNAFASCQSLNGEITFSEKLREIYPYAFANLTNIKGGIKLSDTVEIIWEDAFEYSGFNGELKLGLGIKEIHNWAFKDCFALHGSVNLTNVIYIGNRTFENCISLDGTLTLGQNLKNIGTGAFNNCSNLRGSLNFGDKMTSIASESFKNCQSLNGTITFGNNIININTNAFNSCRKLIGGLNFPASLENIDGSAFADCVSLNGGITFGNKLQTIEWSAFKNCEKISGQLTFPASLNKLGVEAFSGCKTLSGVGLDQLNITEIPDQAFYNCSSLKQSISFLNTPITRIGQAAFYGCKQLTAFFPPQSLLTIEDYAFTNCSGMGGTLITQNITSIGLNAFSNCNFSQLLIYDKLTTLLSNAFSNNPLTAINVNFGSIAIVRGWNGSDQFSGVKETGTLNIKVASPDSAATWLYEFNLRGLPTTWTAIK